MIRWLVARGEMIRWLVARGELLKSIFDMNAKYTRLLFLPGPSCMLQLIIAVLGHM
jgi:hypothetical protein